MINFRVRSLDAVFAQLQGPGLDAALDPESDPNGRFARLHDPELWEPVAGDG